MQFIFFRENWKKKRGGGLVGPKNTFFLRSKNKFGAEILRECSSHTKCHVSCVTCHLSLVTCHLSHVNILPNSRLNQIKTIYWKIWKALYSCGCLFGWLVVVCLGGNSSDVTLACEDAQVINIFIDGKWWMMDNGWGMMNDV